MSGRLIRLAATLALRQARRSSRRRVAGASTPRLAIGAVVLSIAATFAVAAAGPSAAAEPLGGRPPFGWHLGLGSWLVTGLLAFAAAAGALGLTGCLRALRAGWTFDLRGPWIAAALAAVGLALLSPVGSADPGSYVAYGRLAATGHSPYVVPPSALRDSYAAVVEAPWRDTPTIYGPLATGEQWLAAKLAGGGAAGAAHAVFLLDLVGAAAFLLTGLILMRIAAGAGGRHRVLVTYCANPLVLLVGVAGGHLDVLVALFAAAAIGAAGRRRAEPTGGLTRALSAGLLVGAGIAVKASAALVGLALAWTTWRAQATWRARTARATRTVSRDRRRPAGAAAATEALALAVGAALVLLPGYLLVGRPGFGQLGKASGFVSFADPWRLVTDPLQWIFGTGAARSLIRTAAWICAGVMALALARGLPGRRDPRRVHARAVSVLVLGWLFTAPYVLPWYAVPAWALLAMLPASGYDGLLTAWTAVLAIAYLPGRQVALSPALHDVLTGWKSVCSPVLLLVTALGAFLISWRRRA